MAANLVNTTKLSQRISYWADSGNPAHLLAALDEACLIIDSLAKRYRELDSRISESDAHAALMQHGMEYMGSELSAIQALRQTMDAVFTMELPADTCPQCQGTGLWKDNLGQGHFCWACRGKVQS
jgi:hypothetical protein